MRPIVHFGVADHLVLPTIDNASKADLDSMYCEAEPVDLGSSSTHTGMMLAIPSRCGLIVSIQDM